MKQNHGRARDNHFNNYEAAAGRAPVWGTLILGRNGGVGEAQAQGGVAIEDRAHDAPRRLRPPPIWCRMATMSASATTIVTIKRNHGGDRGHHFNNVLLKI